MKKVTVVLASRNAHKVAELQKLLNEQLGDVIELFTSVTPEGKTIVSGSMDGETVFSALV